MLIFWVLFNLFALGLLVLDLTVVHRRGRVVGLRESLAWTAFYVLVTAAFAAFVYFWQGQHVALEFVTGYLLELSLSVDNLFIFLLIFNFFAVPEALQHRALFWGIVGALIMRGVFIAAGVSLIARFHWVLFVFGALLIYSGIRLCFSSEQRVNPAKNPVVRMVRRLIPVTQDYRGGKFLIRNAADGGKLYATPLLVVLLVIETTDVIFSIDSIPAILAITLNAFIVYTSNVLAIIGLRSLYFAVSGLMKVFRFLHYGLALVLVLVGLKMIASGRVEIPIAATLGVVAAVLLSSIGLSVAFPAKDAAVTKP